MACLTLVGSVIVAAPSQAYSECTTKYEARTAVYSNGTCLFVQFSINSAKAPKRVTGEIRGAKVRLKGGTTVSGRVGSHAVRLRDYTAGLPFWSGKVGKATVKINEGVYGLECSIGRSAFRVSSTLFGDGARISDSSGGAVCLALILATGLINEI